MGLIPYTLTKTLFYVPLGTVGGSGDLGHAPLEPTVVVNASRESFASSQRV